MEPKIIHSQQQRKGRDSCQNDPPLALAKVSVMHRRKSCRGERNLEDQGYRRILDDCGNRRTDAPHNASSGPLEGQDWPTSTNPCLHFGFQCHGISPSIPSLDIHAPSPNLSSMYCTQSTHRSPTSKPRMMHSRSAVRG